LKGGGPGGGPGGAQFHTAGDPFEMFASFFGNMGGGGPGMQGGQRIKVTTSGARKGGAFYWLCSGVLCSGVLCSQDSNRSSDGHARTRQNILESMHQPTIA